MSTIQTETAISMSSTNGSNGKGGGIKNVMSNSNMETPLLLTLQNPITSSELLPSEQSVVDVSIGASFNEEVLGENEEDGPPSRPRTLDHMMTNQRVLLVVTCSFALFVIAEIIAAVSSRSLSLLGDAAAMSVDVFSYLTNMIAERIKGSDGVLSQRTRFVLEVAIPAFSITCLLGVTAWITEEAISTLFSPAIEEDYVNVFILYGFASVNFVVDVISFWMFYSKGREVFYSSYEILPQHGELADRPTGGRSRTSKEGNIAQTQTRKNLNMISAFSHVGGDTLRTFSIFVAAAYSTVTGTPGYIVDAWAAAIVAITIVVMVVPLIYEIYKAHQRIGAQWVSSV